jgi:enoyl-CoA hydratase/carnithine racemase
MKPSSLISVLAAVVPSIADVQSSVDFTTFMTSKSDAILTVTLDNKITSVNPFSEIMSFELDQLVTSLQTDNSTKVVIFQSGNPKFFIAHYNQAFSRKARHAQPFPEMPAQNLCREYVIAAVLLRYGCQI